MMIKFAAVVTGTQLSRRGIFETAWAVLQIIRQVHEAGNRFIRPRNHRDRVNKRALTSLLLSTNLLYLTNLTTNREEFLMISRNTWDDEMRKFSTSKANFKQPKE